MKLLTITVPCYNSQAYMEKCIESLLPGGERVEIIIINDGSKDGTGAIADRYASQYPNIVRVIHQENGGHGEGINQGLRHATGRYFKVVDSDDWMNNDFITFLDQLEECSKEDVDLFITNYFYVHTDGKRDRSIGYENALPVNKVFTWSETKSFRLHQMLTIHSCTFRTEAMRKCTQELPQHVFYEDNLMVYQTLPHVNKMYYMDINLYQYFIGRPDQSIQKNVMMQRYTHQLLVTQMCFCACHLDSIREKRLLKYLRHELYMMFAISILYARLHKSQEADATMEQMFASCRQFDKKWADHFRYRTTLRLICIPGWFGHWFAAFVYKFANSVIRFN